MTRRILVTIMVCCLLWLQVAAQKVFTDGSVTYNVSVVNGKEQPGIAEAFDGATLTVAFKGSLVRSDLNSKLRVQTVFFSGKTGTAVILKESGAEKYMINLSEVQWEQYNKRYAGISFQDGTDTKVIGGYTCKKATGTLKGSSITVYYTTDLKPVTQGYEYVFKDLPGFPLEYEITTGNIVVRYEAVSVSNAPVNASRFDLPKSGYKILDYKQ